MAPQQRRSIRITKVSYRKLRSDPGVFGHEAIEAEADVPEWMPAGEALEQLRRWVEMQLGQRPGELTRGQSKEIAGRLRLLADDLEG